MHRTGLAERSLAALISQANDAICQLRQATQVPEMPVQPAAAPTSEETLSRMVQQVAKDVIGQVVTDVARQAAESASAQAVSQVTLALEPLLASRQTASLQACRSFRDVAASSSFRPPEPPNLGVLLEMPIQPLSRIQRDPEPVRRVMPFDALPAAAVPHSAWEGKQGEMLGAYGSQYGCLPMHEQQTHVQMDQFQSLMPTQNSGHDIPFAFSQSFAQPAPMPTLERNQRRLVALAQRALSP